MFKTAEKTFLEFKKQLLLLFIFFNNETKQNYINNFVVDWYFHSLVNC